MSSQQEILKKNSNHKPILQNSITKTNLKNSSSYKKRKNLKLNQNKKLESKTPSSTQSIRVKNTLAVK